MVSGDKLADLEPAVRSGLRVVSGPDWLVSDVGLNPGLAPHDLEEHSDQHRGGLRPPLDRKLHPGVVEVILSGADPPYLEDFPVCVRAPPAAQASPVRSGTHVKAAQKSMPGDQRLHLSLTM